MTSRCGIPWMGAAIVAMAGTLAATPQEEAKPKTIGYISPEIPQVTFPALQGEWQEGLVPDTLDLAERARELSWEGRYAQIGSVKPGDLVELSFPIQERNVKERMWGVDFNLVVKGNSVVFIDPPGRVYPFYQRDHFRRDRVRWVKRRQFVAATPPLDWPY